MLTLLSYILGCLTAIGLILSIASALFHICGWIEEHPVRSQKIGQRLVQVCLSCTILFCITDQIGTLFLVTSILSQGLNYVLFNESMKRKLSLPIRLIIQTTLPIIPHFIVLQTFQADQKVLHETINPEYYTKPKLPGGRLDWDAYSTNTNHSSMRIFTTGEQLSCLALCWLPTLWAYLMAIADSESLPFTSNDRSTKSKRRI